jgi:hypothetical protein
VRRGSHATTSEAIGRTASIRNYGVHANGDSLPEAPRGLLLGCQRERAKSTASASVRCVDDILARADSAAARACRRASPTCGLRLASGTVEVASVALFMLADEPV